MNIDSTPYMSIKIILFYQRFFNFQGIAKGKA
jgi:hypothetical protein